MHPIEPGPDHGDQPIPTPVSGEVVGQVDVMIPSAADQNAAADRARGRTAVQVTWPTAVVILAEWLCAMQDWDLDPYSDGTGFPTTVAAAFVAILTIASAWRMNPKTKG